MVKKIIYIGLITLFLILSCVNIAAEGKETQKAGNIYLANKIHIIIDPGHGGIDSGAVNQYGENEAPINLKISNYLRDYLESFGFYVEMTRYDENALCTEEGNKTIRQRKNEDLLNRINIINKSNADLVISIHLNSFSQGKYYGAQTFYKENSEYSKKAAEIIQKNLKNFIDKDNKRVPQQKKDVKIIDNSKKNFVLVECGFVSNEKEGRLLCTDEYQEKIAWAIFAGIVEYFNTQHIN